MPMTAAQYDTALGSAILGIYAGIKSARKADYEPRMLFELVLDFLNEQESASGQEKWSEPQ
jgi:hypothetical protein